MKILGGAGVDAVMILASQLPPCATRPAPGSIVLRVPASWCELGGSMRLRNVKPSPTPG